MGATGRNRVSICLCILLDISWLCVILYLEGFPFYPLLEMCGY